MANEWAEVYRGSGRYTGRRADEPVRMTNGDVAPGWVWVGDMSEEQFAAECEADVHSAFHSEDRPDFACLLCNAAGWN